MLSLLPCSGCDPCSQPDLGNRLSVRGCIRSNQTYQRDHSIIHWSRGLALSWTGHGRRALNLDLMDKWYKSDLNQLCKQGQNKLTQEYRLKQPCQAFHHGTIFLNDGFKTRLDKKKNPNSNIKSYGRNASLTVI